MTSEDAKPDIDRIMDILEKGGKIYLHPVDFRDAQITILKNGLFSIIDLIVESQFIEQGQMVVCKSEFEPL